MIFWRVACWQTILMKIISYFLQKLGKMSQNLIVVCCSCDWRFKGYLSFACREIFHYIWKKLTEKDCHEWKLTTVDPQERSTWRSGVRSAMRAASQFTWKGAHWCGWCPCTCTLIKNLIMMIMIYIVVFWFVSKLTLSKDSFGNTISVEQFWPSSGQTWFCLPNLGLQELSGDDSGRQRVHHRIR